MDPDFPGIDSKRPPSTDQPRQGQAAQPDLRVWAGMAHWRADDSVDSS